MSSRIELPVKITRPRMTSILARERLFNLLDDCRNQPVTWITGPAGSGKTTLVSSYIEQRKLPYLWYRVDEGDADPATFFYYIGLAAGNVASKKRKKANFTVFTPEYALGLPVFTRRFFENLFQQTNKPIILIFDNFQQVSADSSLPIVIHHASSVVPNGIGLFILSRTRPPPLMARMVANNKIRMIRWDDLRLTHAETGQLIEKYFSQKLTGPEIDQIQEKIDGWVAGLMLLANQTQGHVRQTAPDRSRYNATDHI